MRLGEQSLSHVKYWTWNT